MKYTLFLLWVGGAVMLFLTAVVEYFVSAKGDGKLALKRMGASIIWPLLLVSPSGRSLLVNLMKEFFL